MYTLTMTRTARRPSTETTRILLISRNSVDERFFDEELGEAFDGDYALRRVVHSEDARECDVILVELDDFSRIENRQAPIVVIVDDSDAGRGALAAGAQDFLVRGEIDGKLLQHTIRGAIERNRLLSELRAAHRDLEERVIARTEELSKSNADYETLLHVISHDLKEPLRVIENFSRLITTRAADKLDEKSRDFFARIVAAAGRMGQLLEDIMTLSRAKKIPGDEMETVEAAAVIREVIHRLEGRIHETGAQIHVSDDLPQLAVARTWAAEGVYNILSNALKFVRPGESPVVDIKKYEDEQTAGFAISDRGPGVPPDLCEKIFDFFYRAVGREIEGTGAGLAIARQIAEHHGGRCWCEPREGGGSIFYLTFGKKP